MTASTQRIAINANPLPPPPLLARAAGNIGCRSTAAFLTVGAKGNNLVGRALTRRTVEIAVTPGIDGHHPAPQIWSVPSRRIVAARQRREAFVAVGRAPEVQIIES